MVVLTDAQCRNAKAQDRPYKLSDRHGVHLYIRPSGSKTWRWKYRFAGREKLLTLGTYPSMSLADAREAHAKALEILSSGSDPGVEKRQTKARVRAAAADTFEEMARGWHRVWARNKSEKHAAKVLRALERDAFGRIGHEPIAQIDSRLLLTVLRAIEKRGAIDQAHRMQWHMRAIFDYADSLGLIQRNPAQRLGKALPPVEHGHYRAARTLEEARTLLRAIEAHNAQSGTKLASRLMALTAVRSEALRMAQPGQFEDLDGSEPIWRIPAANMKLSAVQRKKRENEHIVPLAPQAVAVVRAAMKLAQGSPWLFPGVVNPLKPMSDSTLLRLYGRVQDEELRHVPHGWRTTFSTIMNERAELAGRANDRVIIDRMLAHRPLGVEAIYNRAAYLTRRREIAEEWASLLLEGSAPPESLVKHRRR